MDPLNISALLRLSARVINYLGDVKDARDDIKRLRAEVVSAVGILSILKELTATGEVWLVSGRSLMVPDGPLQQYQSSLEYLAERLPEVVGNKRVLTWPFRKGEIIDILSS